MALPAASRRAGHRVVLGSLCVTLLIVATFAMTCGAMHLSAEDVFGALLRRMGGKPAQADDAIVLTLRLPRVLMAALVGAALACSGAVMQGMFRNPLVEPGLIGVSSGSALGAIGVIVLGGGFGAGLLGSFGVTIAAFAGGLLTTALVYAIGRRRPDAATLLLAGVAINAISMAGIGVLTYMASERQLRDLSLWTLGSLGGTDWIRLVAVAPWILLSLLWLPIHARALNALLLGEREASLLGYHTERLQRLLIALTALATSAAVATCGVISFVGLLVPHAIRMMWGPDHRLLLPASALGGAILLIGADTVARTVVAPAELPIGIITALLGGPFFLWLLMRTRTSGVRA
ncbi:iron ABC transporter permease [Dyella caseinilytica]|uniref:Iron ABC transporter permease n=2 Tax=Dyella caseinilytica TaxID=1849581 RepID=A0ABX7H0G7_9GAMM|nr:iron ABC transporter permease [Dyella caseinilytica]